MRTGLTIVKEENGIKFYGELSKYDLMRLKFDAIDQSLMDSVGFNAPEKDTLLVLEMLFRRIGEQLTGQI